MSQRQPGDGFYFDGSDGDEPDSKLGAFVWGVLYGCLVGAGLLSICGVIR